jgi:hypothetical protein
MLGLVAAGLSRALDIACPYNPASLPRRMPDFTPFQWLLAIVAAAGLGIGKAGLAGMSMVHVVIFALLFGARDSTGVVLPMLLVGDVCAVMAYHQHARWDYVRRMLPPACTTRRSSRSSAGSSWA